MCPPHSGFECRLFNLFPSPSLNMSQQYLLPDLLREWPWKRDLSPFYSEAKLQSSTWVESLSPFSRRGQTAFNACDLSMSYHALFTFFSEIQINLCFIDLLASLTYSNRDKGMIASACIHVI